MAVAPFNEPPPTYADPVLVDPVTKKAKFNPLWLSWFVKAANFFAAASDHNNLSNLQGGSAGEYYHLTASQLADLETLLVTVSSGISTTIVTAPLTGLGAPGSMTFTNGILTAQVQAT